MKNTFAFLLSLALLFGAGLARAEAEVVGQIGGWQLHEDKDEMDGSVTRMGFSISENKLDGWLRKTSVFAAIYCEMESFALVSPARFDVEFGEDTQSVRIKIDDNQLMTIDLLSVGVGLGLSPRLHPSYYQKVMNEIAAGTKMKVEVELFGTNKKQVANFDITGFNDVLAWCEESQTGQDSGL